MVGWAQIAIKARAVAVVVTSTALAATAAVGLTALPAAAAGATVDRLSPTFGPVGRVVTITGTGLSTATDVTFNSVDAGAPAVIDDSHLRTTVPDGASTGVVRVVSHDGSAVDGPSFSVQIPTTAAVSISRPDAVFPHTAVVTATLSAAGVPVEGQRARLQRQVRGTTAWHNAQRGESSNRSGRVHWRVGPRATSSYRVVFSDSTGYLGSRTGRAWLHVHPKLILRVPAVAPILTATAITGQIHPMPRSGTVVLDRRQGSGPWQGVATTSVAHHVHFGFSVSFDSTGRYSYRVRRASDATHAAGMSRTHHLRAVQRTLRSGMTGPDVRALQHRLAHLHYDVGPITSSYGYDTVHAVIAFEKVQGMNRDGVVGLDVWQALEHPRHIHLQHPGDATPAGVEVNLRRQVVLYAVNGHIRRILDASTGGGYYYTGSDGTQQKAVTPTGHFSVVYKRDGWVTSDLGTLYRPAYFNYDGYAIHGEDQVPSYPASHGCVRITVPAMDRLNAKLPVGLSVWIY